MNDLISAVWPTEAVSQVFAAHGTLLVPMYVERIRKGSVSSAEQAEVVLDVGAIAAVAS